MAAKKPDEIEISASPEVTTNGHRAETDGATRPPSRRIPSDDFKWVEDDVTYYPHKGQWVEFVGRASVGETRAMLDMDAYFSGRNENAAEFTQGYRRMLRYLARRLVRWNWTDLGKGEPIMPWNEHDELGHSGRDDAGDPVLDCHRFLNEEEAIEALDALETEELNYLRLASSGDAPGQQKNA